MDASHPSRPLGRIMTALCAAVVLFAGAINVAGAQTLPASATTATANAALDQVIAQASPSPAPPAGGTKAPPTPNNPAPANGGGQSTIPARPLPPLSHLPIIDFVATFTQPAYYGSRPGPGVPVTGPTNQYDPLDVGGSVRIPITRKFNLIFDRVTEGTLNQPLECVIQPGVPGGVAARACPSDSRDVLLQYHATYAFDRFVTLDVGDSFRHRIWTNGGNGTSTVPYLCNNNGQSTGPNCTVSSTEHHFGYAGLSYTTKPFRNYWNSVFVFTGTLDRQNVDHHVGMVCSAALIASLHQAANQLTCPNGNGNVGYFDENPSQSQYYETTQGVSWILPVDARHGVTFLLNERWGALNFYENPGIIGNFGTTTGEPYRWNSALTYQLSKRFSPGFTLAMRHSDFHSIPQGTPFVAPNAIHVGSWDLIGTFHVDTNTFFH
ncbi:MAG TPA: hypothetical protein VGU66_18625 [Candidatus Elarobacter sp.]|nr:hypothetical protein [Candidatus Elarobacter sp.]